MLQKVPEVSGYESLSKMYKALKNKHFFITTKRGGGQYGYLDGIISDAVYNIIILGTRFTAPVDPGLQPVFVRGVNSLVQVNELCAYAETKRECRLWKNIKQASKTQIKMEVPGFMIDNIKFPNRGLRHLLARDIVQHLIYNYGQTYQYNIKKKNQALRVVGSKPTI